MTGFGLASLPLAGGPKVQAGRLTVELRSVNSRFLDITFKMPDELRPHEIMLREAITARCKRGKIEVRAQIERPTASVGRVDTEALGLALAAQREVMSHSVNATPMSAAELLRWPGVITNESKADETAADDVANALRDTAMATLTQALSAFIASRESEGAKLADFLRERCAGIDTFTEEAAKLVPEVVARQQQRFIERWNEALKLVGEQGASSPAQLDAAGLAERGIERAIGEAAAFAIRVDVAEEISRLKAHTSECRKLLDQATESTELGKRLDFLVQEMHREANTLGSKSASMELTKTSIELKVLVEQIREQVQNIQ
jgi:uncharacterized protein (TIGR00255 family)